MSELHACCFTMFSKAALQVPGTVACPLMCTCLLHGFYGISSYDLLQSLRQVLFQLRQLADSQSPSSTTTSAKTLRVVTYSSGSRAGTSPLLRSDDELRRSSPKARVAPFWGPGLSPTDTSAHCSNGLQTSAGSNSILSRLHRLCSGERNLRTSARAQDDEASSSSGNSSKLWHFDIGMSEDVLRSMFYKRLCWRLGACAAKESLVAEALQASSTGMITAIHCQSNDWPFQTCRIAAGMAVNCTSTCTPASLSEPIDSFCVFCDISVVSEGIAF